MSPADAPVPADGSSAPPPAQTEAGAEEPPSRWFWLHPVCFALFPLLSLYAANLDQVSYRDAARPLAASLLFALALGGAIFAVFRNARRTALLLTLALFLIFSYGHATDQAEILLNHGPSPLSAIDPPMLPPPMRLVVLGVWFALLVAAWFLARRTPRDLLRPLSAILNFIGVVLVALPLYTIVSSAIYAHGLLAPPPQASLAPDPIGSLRARTPLDPRCAPTAAAPDIYYIILDAYGREDVLQRYYGFDNHAFLQGLRQRGFFVADQARPNYGQTIESISSSLNMTYLDKVPLVPGRSDSYAPLMAMVDHNAVAAALRPHGYKYLAVTTGFDMTIPQSADLILGAEPTSQHRTLTPFDVLALDTTPFANLPTKETTLYDEHRDQLLLGFHDLGEIPRLPFRKFVFAHILAPHPPFVFGPKGEFIRPKNRAYSIADASDFFRRGTRPEYKSGYIGQLQYINTLVLRTIDTIYAHSDVRPVIIVQGDHGPRMFVDWDSLERTDVRETYGNLNAFELPDGSASQVFYPSITPVNSFRLLLDHYFDAGYPRLPDRSYYATLDVPYQFTDVTGKALGVGR